MTDRRFDTLADFLTAIDSPPPPDDAALEAASARNSQLTKPPAALGRLEELAIWMAGWQGSERPAINAAQIAIFAGNHGVAAKGVSAFPSEVTAQMVMNFEAGGAAINQLAKLHGARLDVLPIRLDEPTADFTQGPAMHETEVCEALSMGWNAVRKDCDLLIVGEMGIGNTTSAAALAYANLGGTVQDWVGRGTGVDDSGIARKIDVIEEGFAQNFELCQRPLGALQALGGREIAAMTGALAAARMQSKPVLLDGFIAGAAASVLDTLDSRLCENVQAAHRSGEMGHGRMLELMKMEPILSLGMRLGEGSGAGVALGVLKAALACHSGMATFADAGVSAG